MREAQKPTSSQENHLRNRLLLGILLFGILVRLAIFVSWSFVNPDAHLSVIRYIETYKTIPLANQLDQAYHPPLYHVIGSFFLHFGDVRAVLLLSSILTIATLWVIYLSIKKIWFLQSRTASCFCLLFAAMLPQFVRFSHYISNDALAFLIGSLVFLQMFNYITRPDATNQVVLALYLGLGLLTKGTFLPFVPVLLLLVVMVNLRKNTETKRIVLSLASFIVVFSLIGSYKYVESAIHFGQPFVHNLDFDPPWAAAQKPTYVGMTSLYDVNLLELVKHPTYSDHTRFSYPLLLYGTFWYPYYMEASSGSALDYLGSAIYVVALIPSLVMFIGFLHLLFRGIPQYGSQLHQR
jgi:4-amino-4-deoxy-L-arabinose transferase-like glycosyltransferase